MLIRENTPKILSLLADDFQNVKEYVNNIKVEQHRTNNIVISVDMMFPIFPPDYVLSIKYKVDSKDDDSDDAVN